MSLLNPKSLISRLPKVSQGITPAQWIILGLLTLIFLVGTLPGYFSGQWSWSHPPKIQNVQSFRQLEKEGLNVPGWENVDHAKITIGGKGWIVQRSLVPGHGLLDIFLLPQLYYLDLPMIDWLDLNGLERWSTDSFQTLKFQANNSSSNPITARFFRAWKDDTNAIVQWYAWPQGGNYSPSRWFWKDQQAQIRRQRIPWVAVALKIPIDPLSELKENKELALSLAKSVQNALESQFFVPMGYSLKN